MEEIRKIFPKNGVMDANWTRECDTFPLFAQLLRYPNFIRPLLNAFIRCVGSVTESLVNFSYFFYLSIKARLRRKDLKFQHPKTYKK